MTQFCRRMSETDARNVDMCLVNPSDIFKEDIIEKWKAYQNNLPQKSIDESIKDAPMDEDHLLTEFL